MTSPQPVGSYSLDDRYVRTAGTVHLTGVQALVRAFRDRAILDRTRGCHTATFVAGYEGSPLAGLDLEIARQRGALDGFDIVHRPAVNEELAATSVMGTQLAGSAGRRFKTRGITGYWYGKSPGLDRASDALRHANLIGTDPLGGAVALVGDDPGAKSSTVACASEFALADLMIPTLYPCDPQEALDHAVHAPYLSRFTGLWSGLKIVTAVADGSMTVALDPTRVGPSFGGLGASHHTPDALVIGRNLLRLEQSQIDDRLPRAIEYARANSLNRIVQQGHRDRLGIVAAGKTYLDVREALAMLGISDDALGHYGIRLLKVGMIYPLDAEIVGNFARGLDEIIVVEEKRAFVETAIKDLLYGTANPPRVIGKLDPSGQVLVSASGELDTDSVATALARRLGNEYAIEPVLEWQKRSKRARIELPLLTRTPYFCSGCPHNSSTRVPEGSTVGGGIGCHGMTMLMDDKLVGNVMGVTQMGGEGAQWLGLAPFADEKHFIQHIGDGTFTHSGSLAIRAAVASGENITYKLLYNSTVAMTGGQDPVGAFTLQRLIQLLCAEGVAKIVVTTDDLDRVRSQNLPKEVEVRDRDEMIAVQRELAAVPGTTVLIHDQECAAEKRRKRKRGQIETPTSKVVINERICEGCGDCGEKSNCLSVHPIDTEFGRKTAIHQSSCNVDYSCLKGDCPAFVTVTPGHARVKVHTPPLAGSQLPEPENVRRSDGFAMRILGVGGTGVVTVSQMLATAGLLDGKSVRGLDQTGLAQKGGAVISDLKITVAPQLRSSKLVEGTCDLYLACDSLVGTDSANLKVASRDRTVAVVSTTTVPTGQMIVDTAVSFPDAGTIRDRIDESTRRAVYLDAGHIARELFANEQYANMILVGAAYQAGAIPLTAAAIEQAITLNGAAVETNLQAFRRGRQVVCDPLAAGEMITRRTSSSSPPPPPHAARVIAAAVQAAEGSELARIVLSRAGDLVEYQNDSYAKEYTDFVEQVRVAESVAAGTTIVTEAVARYLYKLMAYKDEYEVARLAVDPAFRSKLAAEFGEDATAKIRLHPPSLRAMGLKDKLALGSWVNPWLRLLYGMRWVRATRLDIFGYSRMRRLERTLVDEYRATILEVAQWLSPQTVELAAEIAGLPDLVRGYEDVKLRAVEIYRTRTAQRLEQLRAGGLTASSSIVV